MTPFKTLALLVIVLATTSCVSLKEYRSLEARLEVAYEEIEDRGEIISQLLESAND